jgi:SAM-dependent methyltransferase
VRTTHGKAAVGARTQGDSALAATLVEALRLDGRVERVTHGFHTYPAGLHPDAAATLVRAFPGRSVLDAFCGGGTVLVEALLAGRRAAGRDVSSVAVLVARARTSRADEATLTRVRSRARALVAEARRARDVPPHDLLEAVGPWHDAPALVELEALRRGLVEAEAHEPRAVVDLLWVCFSAIVVKASHRASDTSARREPRPRAPGTTAILFHKKVRELGRRVAALRDAVPSHVPEADVALGDARGLRLAEPVDLVLTSPPYPTVYDYLPMQALREAWLGVRSPRDREIGARRGFTSIDPRDAHARWLDDTARWTRAAAAALTPGGHLVVVIGDGRVGESVIDARSPTIAAGEAAGLRLRATASVGRTEHARGGVRDEHVIVLADARAAPGPPLDVPPATR